MSVRGRLAQFAASFADWAGFGTKSLQIFYDQSQIPQNILSNSHTGLHSNVLMSPVMWVMRAFTEAQLVVQSRRQDKGGGILWERVVDHDMETLIDRPNDFYDGDALWKGTALSYLINGNAYWRKVRTSFGEPVQLWYVPHWMIRPVWPADGSTFITHYSYSNGLGPPITLLPRDVIHFRFGLDPENPRLGYSPLQAVLREVLTDDEAAKFSEQILENMGVPGLVLSPKGAFKPKPEEVDRLKNYLREAWTGKRRGLPLVMANETEVSQFGFDPQKLMLSSLRDISEERVCAAIGIPAAVVGFGSGLQSTKVGATMRELVKLAWVDCVKPMQVSLGRQLTAQLLPDFQAQTRRFRARFDTSEVSAFQEEAKAEAERISLLVEHNILRHDRAQQALGLEVDPSMAKYRYQLEQAEAESEATPEPAERPNGGEPTESETDSVDQKAMMDAIERRWAVPANTNGNGKH